MATAIRSFARWTASALLALGSSVDPAVAAAAVGESAITG